ncbi:MAG: hypothetical protein H6510_14610 [Acidobacteria bacterium]|nr:hypothetical protein [Acidobacteriota bacterium]MCB9399043.1 hypothetical protein [Acidobacteriota bacterium]
MVFPLTPQPAHPNSPPDHEDDGVDITLIQWMLTLSPQQRLELLKSHNQAVQQLRHAFSRL